LTTPSFNTDQSPLFFGHNFLFFFSRASSSSLLSAQEASNTPPPSLKCRYPLIRGPPPFSPNEVTVTPFQAPELGFPFCGYKRAGCRRPSTFHTSSRFCDSASPFPLQPNRGEGSCKNRLRIEMYLPLLFSLNGPCASAGVCRPQVLLLLPSSACFRGRCLLREFAGFFSLPKVTFCSELRRIRRSSFSFSEVTPFSFAFERVYMEGDDVLLFPPFLYVLLVYRSVRNLFFFSLDW